MKEKKPVMEQLKKVLKDSKIRRYVYITVGVLTLIVIFTVILSGRSDNGQSGEPKDESKSILQNQSTGDFAPVDSDSNDIYSPYSNFSEDSKIIDSSNPEAGYNDKSGYNSQTENNTSDIQSINSRALVQPYIMALHAEEVSGVIDSYGNLGIISCESYINLRSAPNQNDLKNIIGMLENGAAVDVIEIDPEGVIGWAHIRSGGLEGYISSAFLLAGEEANGIAEDLIGPMATVVTDKLRIRSSPEIAEGNTIGSAAAGEKYRVLSRAGTDWIAIMPDNMENVEVAYMSSSIENVRLGYGLNEARSLDLRRKVLNLYDHLGVSKASDYVNIRETPEEDGIKNIVGKFPGYAGADILSEENGWYKLKSGSVTGYVRKDLVATGQEAEKLAIEHADVMAIVNTDALNVRSDPSLNSAVWTSITKEQRYNVLDQMDGWVQLELDSGDDEEEEQKAYVSTRDNNVSVTYALQAAVEYHPAVDAANEAAEFRNKIVNFACQFVGNRYVWGGISLTNGCDCSGFTLSVLKNFGITIPRVSRDQARAGVAVSSENMRPGDLIFYGNRAGIVNHVGMYIGNGQVVNAASRRSGIRIYRWNYRTPLAIRNVIGD